MGLLHSALVHEFEDTKGGGLLGLFRKSKTLIFNNLQKYKLTWDIFLGGRGQKNCSKPLFWQQQKKIIVATICIGQKLFNFFV